MADFLTIDFYKHPVRRTATVRRTAGKALDARPAGLRAATVNSANSGTLAIIPRLTGTCLVLAWDSPDAARDAWAGPLSALRGADYSLDGEIARARVEHEGNDWHGWQPSDTGSEPLASDEPMLVIVHGVVHPRYLKTFLTDNVHAASRAAHHPGHRGSVDVFSKPPFENTSISIWSSSAQARDFAYAAGGHSYAMKHSRALGTHRTGVFLRVRPLASTGSLGIEQPALPQLPETAR
jgi:hypothetical protein